VQAQRVGLSPLGGRYLIVGTSFYYESAGRDGVAAIWAPKSTVGHRRITRNSRALARLCSPGKSSWAVVQRPAEFREPRQLPHRIKSRASCSVRRGGALRHSGQRTDLSSLNCIEPCAGLRAGEPPGVSHCTEIAPNDQRISAFFCIRSGSLSAISCTWRDPERARAISPEGILRWPPPAPRD
jgi:hypothetical protein